MSGIPNVPEALTDKKIAFAHDWLTTVGGADKVVALWTRLFPDAPVYTSVHDPKVTGRLIPPEKVRTSHLQRWPGVTRYYRKLLAFMPRAFEEFDFTEYDVVVSSSSSCAKGVLTPASTLHVSYVHTPMRYAWDLYPEYLRSSGPITRWGMRRMMPRLRQWDALSAQRVDVFLANSAEVAKRIRKTYRREAAVLHPPIDIAYFTPAGGPDKAPAKAGGTVRGDQLGEAYLVMSRLVAYKRVDLAVRTCTRMNRELLVIGSGPEMKKLRAIAGPTVRFLGYRDDDAVREAYRGCRAFLFPGFEDFGMTPLECQACGRPVIAYGRGGALETVVDGFTGTFFPEQTEESLAGAIERFEAATWDPAAMRRHAEGFSEERHLQGLVDAIGRGLT